MSLVEKLKVLKEEPNLSLFDQMESLNGKLRAIEDVIRNIDNKEVKTYEIELSSLIDEIKELQEALNGKDMVVNIPLDSLADKVIKVEQAIKNIKEVKIPEQPKSFPLPDEQINELLYAIQTIPEFPIEDLQKTIIEIGKKIEDIKLETPENEKFDYGFLDDKFRDLIKAVKNVSITVSGGGGGIGERANENLDDIKSNTEGISTEAKQDTAIANQERIIGQNPQADSQSVTFATDHYDEMSRLLATLDAEHSAIHKGWHFFICDYDEAVQNNETIEFVLTTPDTATWTHMNLDYSSTLGAKLDIYEGSTDVVGGATVTPNNNNRNSDSVSGLTILKDPSSITDGTRIAGYLAGANRVSGVVERDRELVLKQNTTYLFRFTSLVNSNAISFCGEWYEYESYSNT